VTSATGKPRHAGFTLIELLVVIAIIAILAAILFPVFARAREKARQASCQSNLKQLALSFQMYAQDFDETLPVNYYNTPAGSTRTFPDGSTASAGPWLWFHMIYPYVNNDQIFNCPTSSGRYAGGYYWDYAACYAYNRWVGKYPWNTNERPTSISIIKKPAETPLLADCDYYLMAPDSNYADNDRRPAPRHNDNLNMAYVDGHVKTVRLDQCVTDGVISNTDSIWVQWVPDYQ